MSDHTRAIVPVEAWAFAAPDVAVEGGSVALGTLAEALIYYDQVLVNPSTQRHLAALLDWAGTQFGDLRALIYDGVLEVYDHSFASAPIFDPRDGQFRLINIQDEAMARPDSFVERYLWHDLVRPSFRTEVMLRQLAAALDGRVTEVKAEQYGNAIRNATADLTDPLRASLLLQRCVNELYRIKSLGAPPTMAAGLTMQGTGITIDWGINFEEFFGDIDKRLSFGNHTPLAAASVSTRLLWSAANEGCDVMAPAPMSDLLGDKLLEVAGKAPRPVGTLSNLKDFADFPDVRGLVNAGHLSLKDVIRIRRRAKRFRRWLQEPGEKDLDAIVAYHSEVAKDRALVRASRRTVSLFGFAAGIGVGQTVDAALGGYIGGAVAGEAVKYCFDVASRIRSGWRPIVFGRWLDQELERYRPTE